jgi:hypothetical protein
MNLHNNRAKPGDRVMLARIPPGLLDGLPDEDQNAIVNALGEPLVLNEYDDTGRAELEFKDERGVIHFIYVDPSYILPIDQDNP